MLQFTAKQFVCASIMFSFINAGRPLSTLSRFNPLMGTLKPHINEPLYRNTVIGTLAVDGWAVTLGAARRGLGGAAMP